jgi:hypothetical protein
MAPALQSQQSRREVAKALAVRMFQRRVTAARSIQRFYRRQLAVSRRALRLAQLVCYRRTELGGAARLGWFTAGRLRALVRAWREWSASESARWSSGVSFSATRAGLLWVHGDRKTLQRKVVLFQDRIELHDVGEARAGAVSGANAGAGADEEPGPEEEPGRGEAAAAAAAATAAAAAPVDLEVAAGAGVAGVQVAVAVAVAVAESCDASAPCAAPCAAGVVAAQEDGCAGVGVFGAAPDCLGSSRGAALSTFQFADIKQVSRGLGPSKNDVTIVLRSMVRDVVSLSNAQAFLSDLEFLLGRHSQVERRRALALALAAQSGGAPKLRRLSSAGVIFKGAGKSESFLPVPEPAAPSAAERAAAVGDLSGLPPALRLALDGLSDELGLFSLAQAPWKDEWAVRFKRLNGGQTYAQWRAGAPCVPAGSHRSKLYLVALGNLDEDGGGVELRKVADFLRAYLYGLDVVILPRMTLCGLHRDRGMRLDVHLTGFEPGKQLATRGRLPVFDTGTPLLVDELEPLLRALLPWDAFMLLGLTLHDCVGGPGLSRGGYLVGNPAERARCVQQRTAVVSLARLDPWFKRSAQREALTLESREQRGRLLLRRSVFWLAQHCLLLCGLEHCPYFACLMNGFVSVEEMHNVPLHCCPVCLRKLMDAVGIKTTQRCVARYLELRVFCRVNEAVFPNELRWYDARARTLEEAHERFRTEERLEQLFGAKHRGDERRAQRVAPRAAQGAERAQQTNDKQEKQPQRAQPVALPGLTRRRGDMLLYS